MSTSSSDITFGQVPRRKLAETVAAQILAGVRGKPAGTRLPTERELTASLGVGRSTVREALNGLAMIGVIEIRHGQGVFVADHGATLPTAIDLASAESRELLEARRIVEVEVARLAALRRTDAQVAELGALLDDHRNDLEQGRSPILQASRFHLLLAEAAQNRVFAAVVRPFFRLMLEKGPTFYELLDGYVQWELDQHQAIFEAVRDRDPDLAAARMREHVEAMTSHYASAVGAEE
jgi:GntR family transcriptional repressor for pyruvate dehydrogenase complex